MQKLFHYNSPFIKWINRMGKLVILNILWLICCIPVITIGASTVSMYRVAIELAQKNNEVSVSNRFFRSFRSDFKHATFVWLILTIPSLLVLLNLGILATGGFGTSVITSIICLIPIPPLLFIHAYVFAYIATFEDKPLRAITNTLIISVSNLPKTLLMVVLNMLPLALYLFATEIFLRLIFVWLLFAFAFIAYLNSKLILRAFNPYMKQNDSGSSDI